MLCALARIGAAFEAACITGRDNMKRSVETYEVDCVG